MVDSSVGRSEGERIDMFSLGHCFILIKWGQKHPKNPNMSREGSWRSRKWRKCIIWLCSWHPAAGQGNLAGLTAAWRQETGQNGPCNGTLQLDRATWLGWQRLGSKKLDRVDQERGSSGKQDFWHFSHLTTEVELEKTKLFVVLLMLLGHWLGNPELGNRH